jgi:hypothetical protein
MAFMLRHFPERDNRRILKHAFRRGKALATSYETYARKSAR